MASRTLAQALARTLDKEPVVVLASALALVSTAAVVVLPVPAYDAKPPASVAVFTKAAPGENPSSAA